MHPVKKLVITVLFSLAVPLVLAAADAVMPTTKPNIVLILIDDFGYENVTADGGESYKTPVMDQLAATGVRFEQCYMQPLCTPTRVELMTGMSNRRNYTNFGTLDLSQKTFGNLLKDAGYATCVTGKWQLGEGYDTPGHFGFDEYALWHLQQKGPRYKDPQLDINGKPFVAAQNSYGPDIVSDYALDFITRKKNTPFFLYYPMMLTHSPFDATPDCPDYLEVQNGKGKKGSPGHFSDMTAYTDKLIGRLIAKLDQLKLRDNTLVLVLGDNGTAKGMPARFMGRDVQGGKGTTTEWGTHVPLIGSWPGHFASAKVLPDLISATDFLPTLCDAAGVLVPEQLQIDGRSFLPQLLGEKGNPRDWLYSWYNPSGGAKAQAEFAHDATFKLYTSGKFFNVAKDDMEKSPLEANTLDDNANAAKAKLQAALNQFAGPRPDYFAKQAKVFKEEEDPLDNGYGQGDAGSKKSRGSIYLYL
jgi:arylsulfatase A